jgi:hypothetical protein
MVFVILVKGKGYIPYAKVTPIEGKARYEALSEEPLTKESALSVAGRYVDQTLSNVGKIVTLKPKLNKRTGKEIKVKVLNLKDNYWENNQQKFRFYTQRKGAKVPLQRTFIEKRKYRLDNPNELRKISSSQRRTPFGF